uniref:Uncharacterized protein n=1 Tax=Picea sitchensis TaxID=3332 RepID=A0A6B9XWN7_PICSI|nr:hypothetical protein Q903MT_gene4050 [Picea sitchensis]
MCGPNLSAQISLLVSCLVKLSLGKLLMQLVLLKESDPGTGYESARSGSTSALAHGTAALSRSGT